ncbi:hypothetical protein [Streptomyces sp. NPDC056549]|uniref:hypothetical protein n=1 Tax=Streptomyces sp. NPDC056549 TaxID=3345864 RepID=UPI0036A1D4F6
MSARAARPGPLRVVPGRKRDIVTDALGLLLAVAVTAANIGDRDAAAGLPMRLRRLYGDITLVWTAAGTLEIVKRTDSVAGFVGAAESAGGRAHVRVDRCCSSTPRMR